MRINWGNCAIVVLASWGVVVITGKLIDYNMAIVAAIAFGFIATVAFPVVSSSKYGD